MCHRLEIRHSRKHFVDKPDGKRPLRRHTMENDIKTDTK
jgi:hypothetical protein